MLMLVKHHLVELAPLMVKVIQSIVGFTHLILDP